MRPQKSLGLVPAMACILFCMFFVCLPLCHVHRYEILPLHGTNLLLPFHECQASGSSSKRTEYFGRAETTVPDIVSFFPDDLPQLHPANFYLDSALSVRAPPYPF